MAKLNFILVHIGDILFPYIIDCINQNDYDYFNKGIIEDIFSVDKGSFLYEKFSNDFILEGKHEILPPTLILKNKNNTLYEKKKRRL